MKADAKQTSGGRRDRAHQKLAFAGHIAGRLGKGERAGWKARKEWRPSTCEEIASVSHMTTA